MRLYHGTVAESLPSIVRDGVRPRGELAGTSNWSHSVESHPDTVYLTTAYACYFAYNAAAEDFEALTPAIVEIETELLERPDMLVPDEDALEQMTRFLPDGELLDELQCGLSYDPRADMSHVAERTRLYREMAAELGDWWVKSIEVMGTCGHRGTVPPGAITRLAVLDKDAPLTLAALDAQVGVNNYGVCGARYRNITRAIFGDVRNLESDPLSMPGEHQRLPELVGNVRVFEPCDLLAEFEP